MDLLSFPTITEKDSQLPLFLSNVGHWDYQLRTKRPDGFPDYQWLQAVTGEGELFVGNRSYRIKPGQGFFLYPNESHTYQPITEPWGVSWIAFNGSLVPTLLQQAGIVHSGAFSLTTPDSLLQHFSSIYIASITGHPFLGMECSKLLYAFMLDLMRTIWTDSPSTAHNYWKLHPVMQYIDNHCHKPITIEEMSHCIGVSPQYLCHLFKTTIKLRPMEYVNRERINKSKEWMFRQPHMKLQEIAAKVGFDNASYFSSVFRKMEGMSPEQFKKSHGRTRSSGEA